MGNIYFCWTLKYFLDIERVRKSNIEFKEYRTTNFFKKLNWKKKECCCRKTKMNNLCLRNCIARSSNIIYFVSIIFNMHIQTYSHEWLIIFNSLKTGFRQTNFISQVSGDRKFLFYYTTEILPGLFSQSILIWRFFQINSYHST